MPSIFLIGSGAADPLEYYKDLIDLSDIIIGVDGGTNHLFSLQHKPDWVIGDNDSISDASLKWLESKKIQLIQYPSEKDKSDFELASDKIISDYSPGVIYLAAMLGGKIEHELLNISIGSKLHHAGFQPIFISEHTWVRYIQKREIVKGYGNKEDLISLIPLTDFIWIKRTLGLKYSLSNEKIEKLSSRGLHNVLLLDRFEIEATEGEALLVYHSKEKVSALYYQGG